MPELVGLLPHDVEVIAGLELGGVPLATMVSQLTGLPTLFVRKQAKTYGTCRLAEGGDVDHLTILSAKHDEFRRKGETGRLISADRS